MIVDDSINKTSDNDKDSTYGRYIWIGILIIVITILISLYQFKEKEVIIKNTNTQFKTFYHTKCHCKQPDGSCPCGM